MRGAVWRKVPHRFCDVQVPVGVVSGDTIQVLTPTGEQMQVMVPQAVVAGQMIQVEPSRLYVDSQEKTRKSPEK